MLWCDAIDARLREWDGSIFTSLTKKAEKLVCPKKCGDEFIRSILGNEDIMRRAHEFERELKASEECLREGEAVLLVLPEGVEYTATFASSHLAEIEQCVEQNGTYGEARENIVKLLSLLQITRAASMVLATASDILASVKDSSGELLNRCTHQLGRAHSLLSAGSLTPPQSVEVGLVDAWAKGVINESEAKAAATSHERAAAISAQLEDIISRVEADEQLAQLFEKSAASSVALGLAESPVEALKKLRPTLTEFEQASGSLLGFVRRFAKLANQGTFSEVREAKRLIDLIQPSVKLTGAKLDGLCDAEAVSSVRSAAVDLISRRAALVPGARPILESARGRIRACLVAAQVAEEASGNLLAIRRPTTLREFRAIGAALPILRSMPALPIGCDAKSYLGNIYSGLVVSEATKAGKLVGWFLTAIDGDDSPQRCIPLHPVGGEENEDWVEACEKYDEKLN